MIRARVCQSIWVVWPERPACMSSCVIGRRRNNNYSENGGMFLTCPRNMCLVNLIMLIKVGGNGGGHGSISSA